jgi:uncharacterized protein YecA (UPF0149 family)
MQMARAELYREFARKCLELADNVESRESRLALFEMARIWHQLAQDQEQVPQRKLSSVRTFRRDAPKVGRNEPCPCGSGKKFKHCCAEATLH